MGRMQISAWFVAIAWFGATASAADWTGDRQMLLDSLRAKDAQFDNLSVEFRQTEVRNYSPLIEWMQEAFLASKFGGEPPSPRPDPSTFAFRKVFHVSLQRLTVRGPATTLEVTQVTDPTGETIGGKLPTARTSNATGVQLRLDSFGDVRVFHGSTRPADKFGLLEEARMLDEFCFGVGYGKRIVSIEGIELGRDAAVVDATMRLWSADVTKARLTIDKDFLVRKAELLAKVVDGETRFEISTEGTTDSAKGSLLATSAHLRRIALKAMSSGEDAVYDDYKTRLISLEANLDDETYKKLSLVDRSLATDCVESK